MCAKSRLHRRVFLSSSVGRVLEPELERLRRLTEISRALTYTTSLDQVTQIAVERAAELLNGWGAVLLLSNDDGMHVGAAHGVPPSTLAHLLATTSEDVFAQLPLALGVEAEAFVAVPLIVAGSVIGLIAVVAEPPITTSDEWILSALADQAAVALENARLVTATAANIDLEHRLVATKGEVGVKDRALSTLAHDIRSPLGAIEGYCALLEDELYGPINDRQRDAVGRVRMSGRHLLGLLENVMEMAKLDAGIVQLDAEPVRIAELARDAVHMLIPAADAKLQNLQLGRVVDIMALGDRDRIRQVLINLIGNAVKYTPQDGSISVSVAEHIDGQSRWAEVRVADTGAGIAESEQAAVFDPYYRSAQTAAIPGVGLGLAISRGLLTRMKGSLHLESEAGKGSTFIVRLPLVVD